MGLIPLHDPAEGVLRVAGLMSGSGTNIRKIIEHQIRIEREHGAPPPFEVVAIFTDNSCSNAVAIGKEFDLPVVVRDLEGFCRRRGVSRRDLKAREDFDRMTVKALSPFEVKVAAYGGYMSIATAPLVEAFLGINVHPADLSIEGPDGRRRFIGGHAVRDAIAAGQRTICASTHVIEHEVDQGRILMISEPMEIYLDPRWDLSNPEDLKKAEAFNQDRLKEHGDWVIFPRTIEDIARGRFCRDEKGDLYYDGIPIPKGWRVGLESPAA
jgi:phosphoribosylglycinamide formyltransferase-1